MEREPIGNKTSKTHGKHEGDRAVPPAEERNAANPRVSIRTRVVLVVAAAAVCVCFVVFGPGLAGLDSQREQSGTIEKDGVAPVVVTSPGDPGQDGSGADVSVTPGLAPAEPAGADADSGYAEPGEVPVTEEERQAGQAMLRKLIGENSAKLEKKDAELVEMEAMFDLLTEMGDDPERIELYRKLIEDTNAEMQEIKEQTARYERELTKE
jgi:hypothetical protein